MGRQPGSHRVTVIKGGTAPVPGVISEAAHTRKSSGQRDTGLTRATRLGPGDNAGDAGCVVDHGAQTVRPGDRVRLAAGL